MFILVDCSRCADGLEGEDPCRECFDRNAALMKSYSDTYADGAVEFVMVAFNGADYCEFPMMTGKSTRGLEAFMLSAGRRNLQVWAQTQVKLTDLQSPHQRIALGTPWLVGLE